MTSISMLRVNLVNKTDLIFYTLMIICIGAFAFITSKLAKADSNIHNEDYYNRAWCSEHDGKAEVRLADNKRVDCLTDEYAVEADWANHKTYESLLQALHYARMTGKKPAVLLLIKDFKGFEWVHLLQRNITHYKLDVKVFIMTAKERMDE